MVPYPNAYAIVRSAFTGLVDHTGGGFRSRMTEEKHEGVGSFSLRKSVAENVQPVYPDHQQPTCDGKYSKT